jgi:fluoride ion exporter CrcB/FEX
MEISCALVRLIRKLGTKMDVRTNLNRFIFSFLCGSILLFFFFFFFFDLFAHAKKKKERHPKFGIWNLEFGIAECGTTGTFSTFGTEVFLSLEKGEEEEQGGKRGEEKERKKDTSGDRGISTFRKCR